MTTRAVSTRSLPRTLAVSAVLLRVCYYRNNSLPRPPPIIPGDYSPAPFPPHYRCSYPATLPPSSTALPMAALRRRFWLELTRNTVQGVQCPLQAVIRDALLTPPLAFGPSLEPQHHDQSGYSAPVDGEGGAHDSWTRVRLARALRQHDLRAFAIRCHEQS